MYIVQLRSRGFLNFLHCTFPYLLSQKEVYCSTEIQRISYHFNVSTFTVTKESILFNWDPEDFLMFFTVHFHIYCNKRKYLVQPRCRGFLMIFDMSMFSVEKKVKSQTEIQRNFQNIFWHLAALISNIKEWRIS